MQLENDAPVASWFIRTLTNEVRALGEALRSPFLGVLLLAVVALLTAAAQVPQRYSFDVGYEEGFGSDLPFVSDFFPFEPEDRNAPLNWRWTSSASSVAFPGFGQRQVGVELHVLPVNQEVQARGAQTVEIWWKDTLIAALPVKPGGAVYHVLLPAETGFRDQQGFVIRSATFAPTNDVREIGVPVDEIGLSTPGGPAPPSWDSLLLWLLAALLAWLGVRRCGFTARSAAVLLGIAVALLGVAAFLDPPRAAFGALPAVTALAWGWLIVIVLRLAAPALARQLNIPLDERSLRWLLLLALAAFALRYGGKIYPQSMWGDIGFHANRYAEVVAGRVLLLSRNRGVDFPYPPALYLLLAPFSLLGIDRRELLRFGGALLDALSPFLVYTIAALTLGSRRRETERHDLVLSPWPVVAAALYSLSAATFMTTWWNFSTHIFSQFTHLLLITALVVAVPPLLVREAASPRRRGLIDWPLVAGLVVLQSLVFLGHFGFWMNTSLLFGVGLAALLLAAWRGAAPWSAFWTLTVAFALAELGAVIWFYSAYTGLFIQQAIATQQGGLTGMAGRAPAPFDALWRTLWNAGFRTHFGFFPVPLALLGLALWWRRPPTIDRPQESVDRARWQVLVALASGTLLVATIFAALPFLTGSTLSTRWLMFSAWMIAVAAVFFVRETWRWGLPVRLAYGLMAAYVLWVTATLWLNALAYRIRPPEPF